MAVVVFNFSFAQVSIFQPTQTPAIPVANDGMMGIEVGVKFRASVDGEISGIRYYKGAGSTGVRTGHLWTSAGVLLAEAEFISETASGWQEVLFSTPVTISANTTYIASCFSSSGDYAVTNPFFHVATVNGPLRALASGEDGPNGLYKFSAVSTFPTDNFQTSNYWVDVVFLPGPDLVPPQVVSVSPNNNAINVSIYATFTADFNEALDPASINGSTVIVTDPSNTVISTNVSYNSSFQRISIVPASPLSYSTTYTVRIEGGASGPRVTDASGNAMNADYVWSFNSVNTPAPINSGNGGPILVLGSSSNRFSFYTGEILRAEGLNGFASADVSSLSASMLNNYDVVILGEVPVSASQVTLLTNWVNAGGTLIAFKPADNLSSLLGISNASGSLSNQYLLVNTVNGPGRGIVSQSMQFHGSANLHTLAGAMSIATLYSDANTSTGNPAATLNLVGPNGGKAIAFAYDLPRSIVYTRQGNPAWAGMERDGESGPIRSNDLFYGPAAGDPQPHWVDFNKIAIPQADEQQRFLANIILQGNLHRKPMPRLWYLPRGLKAAIMMTGDDHAVNGTTGRFDHYITLGPNSAQDVANWNAVRGTSYIFPNTPITSTQVATYQGQGFEFGLHPNTGCADFNMFSLYNDLSTQINSYTANYPGIDPPKTNRTHCLPWSDWASQAKVEASLGIRLDVNYYYWPGTWVQNRAGMFTGSGIPMRFADTDGTMIDCYQSPTQMTDESGIDIAAFCNTLLDRALGAEGYYGVFTTNMHTDIADHSGSNAIIASAQSRNVPVISAKQMLTWLDGRSNTVFGPMTWNSNELSFQVTAAAGSNNLNAMVPFYSSNGQLTAVKRNGTVINFTVEGIKGMQYGFFDVAAGTNTYVAVYTPDNIPPVITYVLAEPHADGTATITWNTSEPGNSRVEYGTDPGALTLHVEEGDPVTSHNITLTGLTLGTTYYFRVITTDAAGNVAIASPTTEPPLSFTMPPPPCFSDVTAADFAMGDTGENTIIAQEGDGVVILKPLYIEEFSGNTVPAGWGEAAYNPGSTVVENGMVTVNGTHIFSNTTYAPGTSIEFAAIFNLGSFQNIGFTIDQPFNSGPWVTIGQGIADGILYARTSDGTAISLGGSLIGSLHRYRLSWNATNFEIYIDGSSTPAATINMPVAQNMYLQVSDFANSDGKLSLDWIRVSPNANPGSYHSRIFDAGSDKLWGEITWSSNTPAGTNLAISIRAGDTPIPDGSWSAFTPIAGPGSLAGVEGRYVQYKADFTTTDNRISATLHEIALYCGENHVVPVVTSDPQSLTACEGTTINLASEATGIPAPTVQWQVSENGTTWTNIPGATNSTLSFTVTEDDDEKRYRAVWTNAAGSDTSAVAEITVKNAPPAPIAFAYNTCGSSLLLAIGYGNLTWSTGETGFYISVNTPGTYSVTQTYNGCTSAPATVVANPGYEPPAPTVTVVNNCGVNSKLTASNYTGSLQWSTGATSASITVTTPGTYWVVQKVGSCTSEKAYATASFATPSTPDIDVDNNCGSTELTADDYTGDLVWSTGETTSSITVTSAGYYWVRQIVNGCASNVRYAYASPKSVPAAPVVNVSNYCGYSVLSVSGSSGTIQWSTGAVGSSITVTSAGAYWAKRISNDCASAATTVNAAPKPEPVAPTIDVDNNCGNTVLTAQGYTGSIQWSNGATTASITVTNGGTYSVRQIVNGCQSDWRSASVSVHHTPATPTVSVSNQCGYSVLTVTNPASNITWSNGSTGTSITVTSGGTYTVKQANGNCVSGTASVVASPKALPATPTITVTNYCGYSVLTAGGYTGSLSWSNGSSSSSITVTNNATYTLKQTVNGCASAAASATAAPKPVPPAPQIATLNLCGMATLSVSGNIGSLLWSNGSTAASITVTVPTLLSVTQTLNGCTSEADWGLAIPLLTPSAPTISVSGPTTFCQGGSVTLTSSASSGNLWSNGATTQSIVVTTSGTYSVRTTSQSGCQSPFSSSRTVTVTPKPSLTTALTASVVSGSAFSYTPASSVPGTTITWSRAVNAGLSNPASSGSGAINEILVNKTNAPVNVTYVVSLSANGCTNTQNVVVTVVPAPIACSFNSSITMDFNSTTINSGRYIWFNNVIDPSGLPSTGAVNFYLTNNKITVSLGGYSSVMTLPDVRIRFDANVTSATTQFINNDWEVQVPLNYSGNVFAGGLAYYLPYSLPGSMLQDVVWSANIASDRAGVSISRKWAAAIYSSFNTNHASLAIKAVDGNLQNPYNNSNKAGTPENYKSYLVSGGTGTGGTNYTGNYSSSVSGTCSGMYTRQMNSGAEQAKQEDVNVKTEVEEMYEGDLKLQVAPNPTSNSFRLAVRASSKNKVSIRILDMFGRVVERHEGLAFNAILTVGQGWTGGTYFAELVQDGKRQLVKLIKTN